MYEERLRVKATKFTVEGCGPCLVNLTHLLSFTFGTQETVLGSGESTKLYLVA